MANPVLVRFLYLLARDIAAGMSDVRPMTPALAERIRALVGEEVGDLDAPLSPDDLENLSGLDPDTP